MTIHNLMRMTALTRGHFFAAVSAHGTAFLTKQCSLAHQLKTERGAASAFVKFRIAVIGQLIFSNNLNGFNRP